MRRHSTQRFSSQFLYTWRDVVTVMARYIQVNLITVLAGAVDNTAGLKITLFLYSVPYTPLVVCSPTTLAGLSKRSGPSVSIESATLVSRSQTHSRLLCTDCQIYFNDVFRASILHVLFPPLRNHLDPLMSVDYATAMANKRPRQRQLSKNQAPAAGWKRQKVADMSDTQKVIS